MNPLGWLLRSLIYAYRYTLSPLLGRQCRFLPTCSSYALDAVDTHGAIKGAWLAARRVCRCHPWGDSGYDPVPPADPPPEAAHPTSPGHRPANEKSSLR